MDNTNLGGLYKSSNPNALMPNTSNSNDSNPETNLANNQTQFIAWQDYEFPVKTKSLKWFIKIIIATIVIGAVLYLLSRDYVTIVALFVGVLILVVYSFRKPKMTNFMIDKYRVVVGKHQFNFLDYRAYFMKEYENHNAVVLIPYKRFAPSVTIYIRADYVDKVVDFISQIIPIGAEPFNMIDFILDWFEI
jgi:hypothetical protein